MLGVAEVDDELRGVVGETDDAVSPLEIEREQGARPHVVEGERDRIVRAPERVFDPRRRAPLDEVRHLHAEVHQPGAVGQQGCPRDADVRDRRREAERAAQADERHERRAAAEGLGRTLRAAPIETLREQR